MTYQIRAPVGGHVVAITRLPLHADIDFIVVGGVAGEVPVLDQGHEQRASLPPGIGQLTRDVTGLVAVIMGHHSVGGRAGRISE